jgi:hypothetical protein
MQRRNVSVNKILAFLYIIGFALIVILVIFIWSGCSYRDQNDDGTISSIDNDPDIALAPTLIL